MGHYYRHSMTKNLELTWTDAIGYVGKGDFETAGWSKPWIVFGLKTTQTPKTTTSNMNKGPKNPLPPMVSGVNPLLIWGSVEPYVYKPKCFKNSLHMVPEWWPPWKLLFFGDVKVELQDLVITIRYNQIIHHHFKIFFLQSIHPTFEYNNHNNNNNNNNNK